jgi:AAA+ ATPase superfamily predicted ATPase
LGVLHEEPTRLFLDDMRESVQAYSIMAVVGKGCHKLSEIAGRLQKPATHLSRLLNRLIQLGYLERERPFGTSPKSNKRSLYKIRDPFMHFFFSFVSPNLSRLELGLTDQVYDNIEPFLNSYVAQEWEYLCRRCIPMAPVAGISFDRASRWWGNNTEGEMMELDLVAESLNKKYLLVGECKWKMIEHPEPILRQLQKKGELLPHQEKKMVLPVLFAKVITAKVEDSGKLFTPDAVMDRLRK